ncbi:hypothetical protein OG520_08565 [Streptomyces sp. NBC_00984]|uniref:hypothetical protein n=1 Tax=Streptomyces sp. NBC_00984 TaxID=2903700 RepID=UPI0038709E80|nr:hypothetical protein OG520_08565 [Streptomyces sp. NBC_00984]
MRDNSRGTVRRRPALVLCAAPLAGGAVGAGAATAVARPAADRTLSDPRRHGAAYRVTSFELPARP